MTKSIRTILTPFLIISYVVGLRTAIPNHPKLWFGITYILLIWSLYYFLSSSTLIISDYIYVTVNENICHYINMFTTLFSIMFGVYHNKKFQNCLKKFDIVDNTLLKLGTMTDYDNLRKKAILCALGWVLIIILSVYYSTLMLKDNYDGCDIASILFYTFLRDYCSYINFIDDLTNASVLQYTGLKFDQINKYLQNLMKNKKHYATQAWGNNRIYPHQCKFSKPLSNKYTSWIIMHLHLELRKISCEINSIFGIQMTMKMASYFAWIVIDLHEIFSIILINNYVKSKISIIVYYLMYLFHHIFKFLLINYMCETISTKANATADLLTKLSYVIYDVEIREIISQFLLQMTYAPLRFYGIGFFQFGFKFIHKFIISIATVLVIIIQAQTNK